MIKASLANRLVFILSLLGLAVAAFLLYEYNFASSMICPTGGGCDIVRVSPYSSFFGISIPVLGVIFYLFMAVLSVLRSHNLDNTLIKNIKLVVGAMGFTFGLYLTYLEGFVINAYCFWCLLSFIISAVILFLLIAPSVKKYEPGN